jgi:nucleotide-binding universal stress UspA family protein
MISTSDMPVTDVAVQSHYHILLPMGDLTFAAQMMAMAQALAKPQQGRVTVLCVVDVPAEKSFSEGATEAQRRRQMLQSLASSNRDDVIDVRTIVRVSHDVWHGINEAASQEGSDLLLLAWKGHTDTPDRIFGRTIDEIMANPPCDVAVVKPAELGPRPRILVPVRGGPYSKLALQMAESLAESLDGQITVMHAVSQSVLAMTSPAGERPFLTFIHEVAGLSRAARVVTARGEPVQAILDEAAKHDLVIMGASAIVPKRPSLGPISEKIAAATQRSMIVVKTRQEPGPFVVPAPVVFSPADISTLVDKWFAESTFHAREFSNVDKLIEMKKKQGLTISLGLPALNEEATIENIIRVIKHELMDRHPLLDEIVLIDSGSTDKTVQIARSFGIPVYVHQEILPSEGARRGKGEALWKSLHVLKGDIIAWIDTDIANIHPKFVYGIIGPLLRERHIQYVKGFYRRPLRVDGEVQAHGGGRVTELTARPLFNLFFPQLSGIIQPLSGEYAGRRRMLEQLPFFTGYGVEAGLLIDIVERYGLSALAQVDLQERIHRNQSLAALSRMSFTIIQVILRRLEERQRLSLLEDMNRSMKMIHYERNRLALEVKELYDVERPPIISISEYRKVHNHD